MHRALYFLITFAESIVGIVGVRLYEMPHYTIERTLSDGVEIRRYDARMAVETTVSGPDRSRAAEQAFGRLFRYITGANTASQAISMTAPVERSIAPRASEMIAMTAPVQTTQGPDGGVTMRFFLPKEVADKGAPQPTDPTVRIVTVAPETIAALRFSGVLNEEIARAHAERLLAVLKQAGISTANAPFVLGYDAPFTIPLFRRNEVAVVLAAPSG